jgi:pimeloyl-ACP methyl ester carboxylesterase
VLAQARRYLTLARWLGPWGTDEARPSKVVRRTVTIPPAGDRDDFQAWLYTPRDRPPETVYLIAPGLHYAGPADPRADRFATILAAGGALVFAPFLPDYIDLHVRPSVIVDFERTFDALLTQPETPAGARPTLFSISFGSLPALRLAANPEYAGRIGATVIFGGYADWDETIEFCLTGCVDGKPHGTRDPLNQPVVMMNLLSDIPEAPDQIEVVTDAWRQYVAATWGRAEMKMDGRWQSVARSIGDKLSARHAEFFYIGCGLEPGAHDMCRRALDRRAERTKFLDPRPHLSGIRSPVHLVHGVDDDVIPYAQTAKLAAALPSHTKPATYLTGLYGHTGQNAPKGIGALARELITMGRILDMLARAGQ